MMHEVPYFAGGPAGARMEARGRSTSKNRRTETDAGMPASSRRPLPVQADTHQRASRPPVAVLNPTISQSSADVLRGTATRIWRHQSVLHALLCERPDWARVAAGAGLGRRVG